MCYPKIWGSSLQKSFLIQLRCICETWHMFLPIYGLSVCISLQHENVHLVYLWVFFSSIDIFSPWTLFDPLHGLWKLSIPQQPGECCPHLPPLHLNYKKQQMYCTLGFSVLSSLFFHLVLMQQQGKCMLPRGGTLWTKCSTLHAACTLRQPSLSSPKPTILHPLLPPMVPPLTVHIAPFMAALIPGKQRHF